MGETDQQREEAFPGRTDCCGRGSEGVSAELGCAGKVLGKKMGEHEKLSGLELEIVGTKLDSWVGPCCHGPRVPCESI